MPISWSNSLAIKTETNGIYAIFLLKKNVRIDIIKTILGYSPIIVLKILKEWNVAITSVRQGYKFTESQKNYRTKTEIIYGEREASMKFEKAKDNFNKDERLKYFNYNTYEHITKECWKPKKERKIRKCYKCDKVGYLVKDCRLGQKKKNRSIQKESDEENDDKQKIEKKLNLTNSEDFPEYI